MPRKKQTKDDPKQRTDKGLEIPIPEREDFFDDLSKGARTPKKPAESESGTPRTSRDQ
jgi:hypothetical protein